MCVWIGGCSGLASLENSKQSTIGVYYAQPSQLKLPSWQARALVTRPDETLLVAEEAVSCS